MRCQGFEHGSWGRSTVGFMYISERKKVGFGGGQMQVGCWASLHTTSSNYPIGSVTWSRVWKEFKVRRNIEAKVEIRRQWKYIEEKDYRKKAQNIILHFRGRRMRTWEEKRVRISRDKKREGPGKTQEAERRQFQTQRGLYSGCHKIDVWLWFRSLGKKLMVIKLNLGKEFIITTTEYNHI